MWIFMWHEGFFPPYFYFFPDVHLSSFSQFHSSIKNLKTSLLRGIENTSNLFHSSFFPPFQNHKMVRVAHTNDPNATLDVDAKWCYQRRKKKVVSILKETVALYPSFSNVDVKFRLIGKICNWLGEINGFPCFFFFSIQLCSNILYGNCTT